MILSLFVLAAVIAGGTCLLWLLGLRRVPLDSQICAGAPVGIVLFGLAGYLAASVVGMGVAAVALATLAAAISLPFAAVQYWRQSANEKPKTASPVIHRGRRLRRLARRAVFWTVAAAFSAAVLTRVMIEPRGGGIAIGNDHNLGDLPFHFAIITGFAWGDNLPPEHPELAGSRLTYPFIADFVAAILVRAGASLREALLLENLFLALALVGTLYRLGLVVGRRPAAGLLTPLLVLLSGGIGFWRFFAEGGGLARLLSLRHDYTITWTGELRWGNALTTLLVPQRSFLLGAPLAVFVFTLLWSALRSSGEARSSFRLAGIVTGLMPLAHGHAFVVTFGVAACLCLLFPRRRRWLSFFLPALALGLPQALWLAHGSSMRARTFLGWQLGWDRGGRSPIRFWLENTGFLLPLLACALIVERWRRRLIFAVPFLVLWIVPNLLRLSPWIWDNIKFLVFAFIGTVPMVAGLLARIGRRGRWGRSMALALVVGLTLSGALDVWRMASRQIQHPLFDGGGVAFADAVKAVTPPRSLILHLPTFNSPVYLTGRRSLVGYPGHIYSQGFDAGDREEEIKRVFEGRADADALLRRYRVDYLLIGPQERMSYVLDQAFLARFPVVAEEGPYRLLAAGTGVSR